MSGREEKTNNKNECESPNVVEKAIDKGKEVVHDTREKVADVVRPEKEEPKEPPGIIEQGKEYVNKASEAISGMLRGNKEGDDKKDGESNK